MFVLTATFPSPHSHNAKATELKLGYKFVLAMAHVNVFCMVFISLLFYGQILQLQQLNREHMLFNKL